MTPEGVEAQACVLTRDSEAWARICYGNATGKRLRSALTLIGPGGHTVTLYREPAAHGRPGICETPRVLSSGAPLAAPAVAEFVGAERAPM